MTLCTLPVKMSLICTVCEQITLSIKIPTQTYEQITFSIKIPTQTYYYRQASDSLCTH